MKKFDTVWVFFAVIFVVSLGLDQISKAIALESLDFGRSVEFGLSLAYNKGVAFGIALPIWLIFAATIGFLGLAIYFVVKEKIWRNYWHLTALALLFAGGIGNLIDRVRFGYVIDFLKVYWWPNFNLADVFIVAAVVMLAMSMLKNKSLEE